MARPEPTAYYGLLTNPPGRYSMVPHKDTTAVTFRGSESFIATASTLFCSFGGEVKRITKQGTSRFERREPVVHRGMAPDTAYLYMPKHRIEMVLRSYLYGQLCATKAQRHLVRDDEGDIIEIEYLNEEALAQEATQLALAFMAFEMEGDYGVVEASWGGTGGGMDEYQLSDDRVLGQVIEDADGMGWGAKGA